MPGRDNPEDVKMVVTFLRLLRGWTQAELAEAAGLSLSAVWRYENENLVDSEPVLEEIALAVGLPSRMLDRVFTWVAAARAALASAIDPGDPDLRIDAIASEMTAGLSDLVYSATALILRGSPELEIGPWARPAAPPCPQDRQEAEELWEVLKSHEPSMRRVFVEDSRRFQKWALCERLCAESIQALAGSVDEALELAELALLVAERTSGEESWCQRLQGYAWAHIANAHRARGDRPGAKEAFSHARQLWQAGAPSDPGLLEEARMLDLEAARGSYRIV